MRRLLLIAAGATTALFLAWGCYFLVDALARQDLTRTERFAAVGTVHLDVQGGGPIRVIGDATDTIEVELAWTEGLRSASVSARPDGDRIVVRTRCPAGIDHFCSAGATVHVPPGTAVTGAGRSSVSVIGVGGPVDLALDVGGVRVEGAVGPVGVRTDVGRIVAVGTTGDLDLRSDHGSVRAEGARADRITATSDNGSVHLDLARAPDRVEASSDNGSVTVLLPADAPAYATDLHSDHGSVENLVRTEPAADRAVVARSANGDVSLRYRG